MRPVLHPVLAAACLWAGTSLHPVAHAGTCAGDLDILSAVGAGVLSVDLCAEDDTPGVNDGCGPNGRDVTVDWVAPYAGLYQFKATGAGTNVDMGVRDASSCSLDVLECDNHSGEDGAHVFVEAGDALQIHLDTDSGGCGVVTLDIDGCDNAIDLDLDGVCDDFDRCVGDDRSGDLDGDGVCEDTDLVCDPTDIDLGSALGPNVASGTTCGAGNSIWRHAGHDVTCGLDQQGEDVVHRWTAPNAGTLTVTADGGGGDVLLTARAASDCGVTELACDVDIGVGFSNFTLEVEQGDEILLVADLRGAGCSAYQLNLELECAADADGDGVCDSDDVCIGDDTLGDGNSDGVCGDCDVELSMTGLGPALGSADVCTWGTSGWHPPGANSAGTGLVRYTPVVDGAHLFVVNHHGWWAGITRDLETCPDTSPSSSTTSFGSVLPTEIAGLTAGQPVEFWLGAHTGCGTADIDVWSCDADSDADGVDDCTEVLAGADPTLLDTDADGLDDALDDCPNDPLDDADGDGVCGDVDLRLGDDATGDIDGNGTCDDLDTCNLAPADGGSSIGTLVETISTCAQGGFPGGRTCTFLPDDTTEWGHVAWTAPTNGSWTVTANPSSHPIEGIDALRLSFATECGANLARDDSDSCDGVDSGGELEATVKLAAGETVWASVGAGPNLCETYTIAVQPCASTDTDGDGVCDRVDECDGDDFTGDVDHDRVCDDLDVCDGYDAFGDSDLDGTCDPFLNAGYDFIEHEIMIAAWLPSGAPYRILASLAGPGTGQCWLGGAACTDLDSPRVVVRGTAPVGGYVERRIPLPASVAIGTELSFQVIALRRQPTRGEATNVATFVLSDDL